MIQNDDFLEALDRASTPREAAHLIEKYEYE